MNRIRTLLKQAKAEGRQLLVPYLMAGDPDLPTSLELATALMEGGADLLEIGLPFSDPLADGPVIQGAAQRALRAGTKINGVLEMVASLRRRSSIPLVLLSYVNPILRYGFERFLAATARAGADGLIIPDLPLAESGGPGEEEDLAERAARHGLELVPLVAPTTTVAGLREVAKRNPAFVYVVSLTGVTGVRAGLAPEIHSFLTRLREQIDQPLFLGFGLSGPQQIRQVRPLVDGVIVGSRLVQEIAAVSEVGLTTVKARLQGVLQELRRALDEEKVAGQGGEKIC